MTEGAQMNLDAISCTQNIFPLSQLVSLVTGAKDASLNASARRALRDVTQSLVNVCVRLVSLETTVKRVGPLLYSKRLYLNKCCHHEVIQTSNILLSAAVVLQYLVN